MYIEKGKYSSCMIQLALISCLKRFHK